MDSKEGIKHVNVTVDSVKMWSLHPSNYSDETIMIIILEKQIIIKPLKLPEHNILNWTVNFLIISNDIFLKSCQNKNILRLW